MDVAPTTDERFKTALGSLAAGINLITVWDAEERARGMTATAMCSVSLEPRLILVCVNRSTRTHYDIERAGRFGVSILGAGATHISNHCAVPGSDKYLEPGWLAPSEACASPALADALAHLDCTVHARHSAGTHSVVIGAVETVGIGGDAAPLIHFQGKYRTLEQTPTATL